MSAELIAFAPIWILVFGALALLLADTFARVREPGFLRNLALAVVGLAFALMYCMAACR